VDIDDMLTALSSMSKATPPTLIISILLACAPSSMPFNFVSILDTLLDKPPTVPSNV
jgi:hypothetical protein